MICKTCGNKLAEGAAFCENCGMSAESALCVEKETPASQKTGQSRKVTENIWLCPDGVYRWIHCIYEDNSWQSGISEGINNKAKQRVKRFTQDERYSGQYVFSSLVQPSGA